MTYIIVILGCMFIFFMIWPEVREILDMRKFNKNMPKKYAAWRRDRW